MPRPRLRRVNGQVDNSCLVMVKVLDPPPDPQCIKATSQLGGSVLRSAVPTWASRNRAHCFTPPDSSQAPNPGEWPPGPGFGASRIAWDGHWGRPGRGDREPDNERRGRRLHALQLGSAALPRMKSASSLAAAAVARAVSRSCGAGSTPVTRAPRPAAIIAALPVPQPRSRTTSFGPGTR